jgi:hypothetical protein
LCLAASVTSVDDLPMAKSIGVFTLGIAVVVGCSSQQAAPEPRTGPPGVDIEYNDREDEAAPKSGDAESAAEEKESAKDEVSSPSKDESESKAAPAKKDCTGLKKANCEVTVGCAWSSDKKCVHQ